MVKQIDNVLPSLDSINEGLLYASSVLEFSQADLNKLFFSSVAEAIDFYLLSQTDKSILTFDTKNLIKLAYDNKTFLKEYRR